MPEIANHPTIYPTNLFSQSPDKSLWWILHLRARSEKVQARYLKDKEIPFFLPLHEHVRRVQRRKAVSWLPLFPNYLFLFADEDERQEVFATQLVIGCLKIQDQPKLHGELAQIHQVLELGVSMIPTNCPKPGMRARIIRGALSGCEGEVLQAQNGYKLILRIQMLGRAAEVELDADSVELL